MLLPHAQIPEADYLVGHFGKVSTGVQAEA